MNANENNAASSFTEAKARAQIAAAAASQSQTWTTVKSAAQAGLYVGVFFATVIVITSATKAAAGAVFGNSDK